MRNEQVRVLQEQLRALGYFTFPVSTGYFGPITLQAVRTFQRAHNLPETGYVGILTREMMTPLVSKGGKKPLDINFEEIVELFVSKGILPSEKREQALTIVALQR
jgi:hypothetical protein